MLPVWATLKAFLAVQGIQGDECVLGDAQFGEQRLGGGDLAGFLADLGLSVICVQKVPLRKVCKINELNPGAVC